MHLACRRPRSPRRRAIQAEVELVLPGSQPLTANGPQQLQLDLVMGRPDVLDLPRPTATGVHDLHRAGTRRRPHRTDVRGHRPTIEPRLVPPSETLDARSRRSAHRSQREAAIVSKVRRA